MEIVKQSEGFSGEFAVAGAFCMVSCSERAYFREMVRKLRKRMSSTIRSNIANLLVANFG
jgi:hypothetical protein